MAQLSISEAVGAGFKLLGQRPVSVFAWGLFAIVLGVAPALLIFGSVLPDIQQLAQLKVTNPNAAPPPEMLHLIRHGMMFNPLANLLSILVRTVLAAAIFRAILEPNKRSFAGLRLGMQELWVFLVTMVMAILLGIAFVLVFFADAAVIAIVAATVSKTAAAWTACVLILASIIGCVWVALRLSFAAVMSFDERSFRLFESWRVTRGHAGGLFLMSLLLIVILFAVELVVAAVFGVPIMMFAGAHFASHDALNAFVHQPPQQLIQSVAPYAIVFAIIGAYFIGAISAIFIAPWAAAYKMVKGEA